MIRYTCGDTKILSNIKMSQNIITRIVATASLPHTIWPIFPFPLIFCYYFTRLKVHEISLQNMRNLKNIDRVVLGIVR